MRIYFRTSEKARYRIMAAFIVAALVGGLIGGLTGCRKKTPDDLMQEAVTAAQSGDMLGAQLKCEKVIEKWPDDPVSMHARFVLAALYVQDGSGDKAREYWRDIIEKAGVTDEVGQEAYQSLIVHIAREDGFEQAIEEIHASSSTLAASPAFARTIQTVLLSDLYTETGQFDAARDALRRAMDTMEDPEEERSLVERLAAVESQAKDPMAAAGVWQRYLDAHPDSPEKAGLIARIASYYREASEKTEDPAEATLRKEEANRLLEESISLFQKDIDDLGEKIAAAPKSNESELSLEAMLSTPTLIDARETGLPAQEPSNGEMLGAQREAARSQLIQILMWDNRFDAAEGVRLRQIDEATTDSEKILGILGLAIVKYSAGKSEEAIALLQDTLEKYKEAPEVPVILTHIAEIHYLTGNYEASREIYSDIANRFPTTREGYRAVEAIRLVQEKMEEQNRANTLAADGLSTASLEQGGQESPVEGDTLSSTATLENMEAPVNP